MPRGKQLDKQRKKVVKKWVVDTIHHDAWPAYEVDVSVCPIEGSFWVLCKVLGIVEAPERLQVIALWKELYEKALSPTLLWEKVIVVARVDHDKYKRDEQSDMYVGFEQLLRARRVEVTAVAYPSYDTERQWGRVSKKTLWRPFEEDEVETVLPVTKKGATVPVHGINRLRAPKYSAQILPYSEHAWEVLTSARDQLREMHQMLDELLDNKPDEVVARLEGMVPSSRMLTDRQAS